MIKISNKLTENCKNIRERVFVKEQGFKEEFDNYDNISTHYEFYEDGKCVGTIRYFKENDHYHLGRLAVDKEYRNKHIGSRLVKKVIEDLKKEAPSILLLNSQEDKVSFYEKLGFTNTGYVFYEQGVKHYEMILKI